MGHWSKLVGPVRHPSHADSGGRRVPQTLILREPVGAPRLAGCAVLLGGVMLLGAS